MSSALKSFAKTVFRFTVPIILASAAIYLVPMRANSHSPIKSSINNWANGISAKVAKVGVDMAIRNGEYHHSEAIDKDLRIYISPDESGFYDVLTFKYDFTFSLAFSMWIMLLAGQFILSKQTVKDALVVTSKVATISAIAFFAMFILRDLVFGAIVAIKGVRIVGTFDNQVRMAIILLMAGLIVLPSWSSERRSK